MSEVSRDIVTARGDLLDLDGLIAKSKRPINFREKASVVPPRPVVRGAQPTVRGGFIPARGDVADQAPIARGVEPVDALKRPPVSALNPEGDQTSMSELTGIDIRKENLSPLRLAELKKGVDETDAISVADATLQGIAQSTTESSPRAVQEANRIDQERVRPRRKGALAALEQEASDDQ